ncbi:putative fatty-acid-CoA ligase FadD [Microtetraspora sp. NBRC 13810]|uniref:class I adenylate-forming enzyme family protein n=1 Tax=Microtetraspora sp. NBRC 13810 TaxID=3030990 RepID=UPI0024A16550|nr:AMP-binding protein [Microtetraspora sp. NBRC 13810]GLW09420.1 putative fatty-acid-CoA ligase FadD [Microtetraspora sp. NBRC 13810]
MFLQRINNRGIRLGTLYDRAAARHPASPVILDHELDIAPERGRLLVLTELADLVDDFASRLWAARVRPGERVVVYKSHGFDISLLACALARIGAIPALLSPKLDGATVRELMRRMGRPHLVTDQVKLETELTDKVFELADHVLLASGAHPEATPLAELAGVDRVTPVNMPPDHPTLITHTSGTTGIPKLAVHTGRTLQARYRPQATIVAAAVRRSEPIAIHVSFVHSRMYTAMPISVLQGHPMIVMRDDDPKAAADLFSRFPPGFIEAHPNAFLRWEVLADDPRAPLANVKYFSSTFDAIHPRTVHRMLCASRRRAPRFAQAYGQSEVGPIAARTYSKKGGAEFDARCVGRPFPGMTDVRVVSRDGKRPTKSSPGYIEVLSNGRIVTYLGEHERWEKQAKGEWWRMGDVGYRTKWGCLHMLDREVDEIPGIDSTLEIEDKLLTRLPELIEVILVPNEHDLPQPVVSTRDDAPLDPAAWRAAVAGLPEMADPVQWRQEDLPQTATTKIKRLELAKLLRSGARPYTGDSRPEPA